MPDLDSWVIDLRHEFHRFPELSHSEQRTAARVEEILGSLGIETRRVAGTGVIGRLHGRESGKTVALRADMDALQQTEKTGLPYASENSGLMHACGHDAHTAMLLGAARKLAEGRDALRGDVVFLFQPAEEMATGAMMMIAEGALEGVGAIFGMHVFANAPTGGLLPTGTVAILPGPVAAGADFFRVTVKGKGGHAAMPQLAVDSIFPAALMLTGIRAIVTAEMDAMDPVVITVGQIHGGTRFNIIADETWFDGTVRYFRPELGGLVQEKIKRIVEGTAQAHRVEVDLLYNTMVPPTVNDPGLAELARQVAAGVAGPGQMTDFAPMMGSEDFSFFASRIPGVFIGLGAGNEAKGAVYANHHPQFTIDKMPWRSGSRCTSGSPKPSWAAEVSVPSPGSSPRPSVATSAHLDQGLHPPWRVQLGPLHRLPGAHANPAGLHRTARWQ
ncbi:MAG TPA: amidohydrolase [Bacillota bacterium]